VFSFIFELQSKLRLGRLMCGKALPFRGAYLIDFSAARLSLAAEWSKKTQPERQSLSAHQAAKPRRRKYSFFKVDPYQARSENCEARVQAIRDHH
jgi:hypothetical protein